MNTGSVRVSITAEDHASGPMTVTFLMLVELSVVAILREAGVSLQRIRRIRGHWPLAQQPHVLATKNALEALIADKSLPQAARDGIACLMAQLDFEAWQEVPS